MTLRLGNLRKRFVKKNRTAAVVRKRSRTKDAETRRGQAILHLVKSNNFIRFRPLLRSQPHLQRYKLFWVCDKTDLTQEMARNIIEDTQPGLTPNPAWNSKTMAFAVASKILATAHTQRAQFSACESTLMEAINLLRTGDNTCRIRAIGLCLTLSSWKHRRWDYGDGNVSGLQAKFEVRSLLSKPVKLSRLPINYAEDVSHIGCLRAQEDNNKVLNLWRDIITENVRSAK
ncbi:hypothetical protein BKA59DRAFT_450154 [Fusarium tricinctum]|uniref:Uncharacterized protein n=1 Tax=Fusarium tricinctum TaxID=61284 RepID=A0A8K0S621_9HYPO|nr:hypothetical protein BKA59DRAFT_450154 [Fusarium tricinctum]